MNDALRIMNQSDTELTLQAAVGHRDSFARIVARYQSLICSLAYSATGNLSRSEDMAQETFVAAWKGLKKLREPEKLRSWLCGIVRNIAAADARGAKHDPMRAARELNTAMNIPSSEAAQVNRVISNEEETILWSSLRQIPSSYREPLILFYREEQSIENVARQLGLSQEAVKQRLSRGRKLLRKEIETFVETALRKSGPGPNFTSIVLAGLPEASLTAAATGSVGKGVSLTKTGSFLVFLGGIAAPILGAVGGVMSMIGFVKDFHKRKQALQNTHSQKSVVSRSKENSSKNEVRALSDAHISKWSLYGMLMGAIFSNPFATLSVHAAKARDSVTLFAILAILVVTFPLARPHFFNTFREQKIRAIFVLESVYLVFLLAAIFLRWEAWKGYPAWQSPFQEAPLLIIVGFLLFAVFLIAWVRQKNKPRHADF